MRTSKILIIFLSTYSLAQIQTPQSSPKAIVMQTVGLTEVKLDYSRPAMRDRIIMGELVPFGEIWRTGANANTKISFSDDVKVGGKFLKAGEYSIFSRPGISMWEIFFYSKTDNSGLPDKWDVKKIVAALEIETHELKKAKENFNVELQSFSIQIHGAAHHKYFQTS